MTEGAPLSSDANAKDPLHDARVSFNAELANPEYNQNIIFTRINVLESALIGSEISPEDIYHELELRVGDAIVKAKDTNDADHLDALGTMQKRFSQSREIFQAKNTQAKNAPTNTDNLPPMTQRKK